MESIKLIKGQKNFTAKNNLNHQTRTPIAVETQVELRGLRDLGIRACELVSLISVEGEMKGN